MQELSMYNHPHASRSAICKSSCNSFQILVSFQLTASESWMQSVHKIRWGSRAIRGPSVRIGGQEVSGAYQDVEAAKVLLYTIDHLPTKRVGQQGQEVQGSLCRINDTPLDLVLVNWQPKYMLPLHYCGGAWYLISAGFMTSAALCPHFTPNSPSISACFCRASSGVTKPCITTSAPAFAKPCSMPYPMPCVEPAPDTSLA